MTLFPFGTLPLHLVSTHAWGPPSVHLRLETSSATSQLLFLVSSGQ